MGRRRRLLQFLDHIWEQLLKLRLRQPNGVLALLSGCLCPFGARVTCLLLQVAVGSKVRTHHPFFHAETFDRFAVSQRLGKLRNQLGLLGHLVKYVFIS